MFSLVRLVRRSLIRRGLIAPRIFVGCALTHAPEGFKNQVNWLKLQLKRNGWEVLEFLGLKVGTAKDVYEWDILKCVGRCDFLVAVCDYASIGLGYELATATEKHEIWVLAVAHADADISRLPQGVTHRRYSFARYRDLGEVESFIKDIIEN